METLFTWLHLSDLHVRALPDEGAGLDDPMLAALRRDAEDQADAPVDAIFVTGDIAWSGQREEYVAADAYLVGLSRALAVGPERVYVVAGNHDVDRNADRAALTGKLMSELRGGRRRLDAALEHAKAREVLSTRLYPFAVFAATFGPPPADDDAPLEDQLWWSHRVDARGGLRVRVVGLCTAFLAEGDTDRGLLRMGEHQLQDAADGLRAGELVIALSHHPAQGGWLADERDAETWLREHAHVHVTGHAHDAVADEARGGAPGPCVWIATGAAPAKRKVGPGADRRLGYAIASVVRSTDGAMYVRIAPRRWSPETRRFVLDDRRVPAGQTAATQLLRLVSPAQMLRASAPPPAALAKPSVPPAPFGASAGSYSFTPTTPVPPPSDVAPIPRTPAPPTVNPFTPGPRALTARRPSTPAPPMVDAFTPSFPPAPYKPRVSPIAPPPPPVSPARAATPEPPSASTYPRVVTARSGDGTAPTARNITDRAGFFEGPGALPVTAPALFTARDRELDALESALASPAVSTVVVIGMGGIGKTALVQQLVATRAPDLFDESAWLDGRDVASEIGRVAKRFGWRGEQAGAGDARSFLKATLERRRVLLVIDHVSPGAADVRALPIPEGGSRTILTSRILTLHEDIGRAAQPIRLGGWDDATSRAHLLDLVPTLAAEPSDVLDALTARVSGLPLAVRLVGRQLGQPDVSVRGLAMALDRDMRTALDGGARRGEPTVTSTFQPAFDALVEPLREALVALAACAMETRAGIVAEIAAAREDEVALALEGLAEQALVVWDQQAERPFRLHPVVRAFLRSRPGASEAEAAHEGFVLGHVLSHADPAAWPELELDLPEVFAVIDRRVARGDAGGAWELLKAVLALLERRDRYTDFIGAARRILRAAPEGGPTAAAVLADLGVALASMGEIAEARDALSQSLALAEDGGYHDTEALALGGLGRVHAILGELAEATAHHRRAGALHELLGMRRLFAIDLGNVGLLLRRTGNVGDAIEYLERSLSLHEELDEPEGRAESLGGLGLCFRDIGELDTAVEHFQRALAIHEDLGRRAGQATMLGNLGNTYRARGDVREAIDHLERALAIYDELGMPEGQGAALGNLGACYRATGDLARARDLYERALAALRRIGLGDDHPHVRVILGALAVGARRARG